MRFFGQPVGEKHVAAAEAEEAVVGPLKSAAESVQAELLVALFVRPQVLAGVMVVVGVVFVDVVVFVFGKQ